MRIRHHHVTRISRLLTVVAVCAGLADDAAAQGSAETDRAALEALYDATDGPNWADSTNWKTAAPLDQWHGVTMHEGRVWGLNLRDNALTGSVPRDLGSLTNVRSLYLSSNELTGSIPRELGNLRNLEGLGLWGNELTGPIPRELGNLTNLRWLLLSSNELRGPIPRELGNLTNLRWLHLSWNELRGPIPRELGNLTNLNVLHLSSNELTGSTAWLANLTNLEELDLSANWGISGTLPPGQQAQSLEKLDIFFTQTCAPAAWRDWLKNIEFDGRLCGAGSVTIDVAVVYTPAAREEAGGTAAIEAVIDLMVFETNQAYAESGVGHRVALVERLEVSYTEAGDGRDLDRLEDPSDGYMDEVHALRDRTGADLVHLIFKYEDHPFGGRANLAGPFGVTCQDCGGGVFAHELGHNMMIRHDRYEESMVRDSSDGMLRSDPAYGYVNQRAFGAGAPESSRWRTIMAYDTQCDDAGVRCRRLLRFSNPRQSYAGDPLGIPFGEGSGVTGPADAVAVLNATGPAVALWRDRPGANRPPVAVGSLPDRVLAPDAALDVDVSRAFVDPDGDALTWTVSSSAPDVVTVLASGARVKLTAVGVGTSAVRVTATDPGGLSAAQAFTVTVTAGPAGDPTRTVPATLDVTCHGYDEGATRAYNCIPEPSQQHYMRTFVPAVGSACDQGRIAEFPAGRIVFQIRCRDGSSGQSAAWSYAGRGRASFVKPVDTPRVWLRTSFSGSSAHLSVWCRSPQEYLAVNELLGTSWGNDGTNGNYGMAGCREVEVDAEAEDLLWWFAPEPTATALTPPRSWERMTGAGSALAAEALQDLAAAVELERDWGRPGRRRLNPGRDASTPDDDTDALEGPSLRNAVRTSPLTLDLTCHGYNEGATRAYNCIPVSSQQHHMRTFVPAVGSACDGGRVAEFPAGRIVFQIRCRDSAAGQSAAWSYSGRGPEFFIKPVDISRIWVRTAFSGSSAHLSVWCRSPQERLVVNELLGTSWGNDGTYGVYGMAGCRVVEVDTDGQDLQWWFTQELDATALTPPRLWERVTEADSALPVEARQDLATAVEQERLWPPPRR